MSKELEKAIELFCAVLPENKIGTYSPQPNDDARLKEILETELKMTQIYDLVTKKETYKNEYILQVNKNDN